MWNPLYFACTDERHKRSYFLPPKYGYAKFLIFLQNRIEKWTIALLIEVDRIRVCVMNLNGIWKDLIASK
jgi:hypothetical protein